MFESETDCEKEEDKQIIQSHLQVHVQYQNSNAFNISLSTMSVVIFIARHAPRKHAFIIHSTIR